MFKKQTELPPEPKLITKEQIQEDLVVPAEDPLYSVDVKNLLMNNEIIDSGVKMEDNHSKPFQTVDKLLKTKEDVLTHRKLLLAGLDGLHLIDEQLNQYGSIINRVHKN